MPGSFLTGVYCMQMKEESSELVELTIKNLYEKTHKCIKEKKEDDAVALCYELYELANTLSQEQREKYSSELFFITEYLYKFHRNNHFKIKHTNDKWLVEKELLHTLSFALKVFTINFDELILRCTAMDFEADKEPSDHYYQLVLVSAQLVNKFLKINDIPQNHLAMLRELFLKASEACFKRNDASWMDFIVAYECISDNGLAKNAKKIKRMDDNTKLTVLYDLMINPNKNDEYTFIRAKHFIELVDSLKMSKEKKANYAIALMNAYLLNGLNKRQSSDKTRIASYLLELYNFQQAFCYGNQNIEALCQMILTLHEIIQKFDNVYVTRIHELLQIFYDKVYANNAYIQDLSVDVALPIYKVFEPTLYFSKITDETIQQKIFTTFYLLAFKLVEPCGFYYPVLHADVGKFIETQIDTNVLNDVENKFLIISHYFRGCIENCEKTNNSMRAFFKKYGKKDTAELILSDLDAMHLFFVKNPGRLIITKKIMELILHLEEDLDIPVLKNGMFVKSMLQLYLLDSLVKSFMANKVCSRDHLDSINLVASILKEENSTSINNVLYTYQNLIEDFRQKNIPALPRVQFIEADATPAAKKDEKKTLHRQDNNAIKSAPQAESETVRKGRRKNRKHRKGKYKPLTGMLTEDLGSMITNKNDVSAVVQSSADNKVVIKEPLIAASLPMMRSVRDTMLPVLLDSKPSQEYKALTQPASQHFLQSSVWIIPAANSLPQPGIPASGKLAIDPLVSQLLYHLGNAYVVGGYPYALLTGDDKTNDFDIVWGIEPPPEHIKWIRLGTCNFRRHPQKTNLFQYRFTVEQDGVPLTIKYDLYCSEALPISMEMDASRRNFRRTTVYLRADGSYFMPIPGTAHDIKNRLVQLVRKDGLKSFEDDPIQLLQYFYFTLSKDCIGIYGADQLKPLYPHLRDKAKINEDQIFGRLNRFFLEGNAVKSFEGLWEAELIQFLFPRIREEYGYELRIAMQEVDEFYHLYRQGNLEYALDYAAVYLPFVFTQLKTMIDYGEVLLTDLEDREIFDPTVSSIILEQGFPEKLAHIILGIKSVKNPYPVNRYLDMINDKLRDAYPTQEQEKQCSTQAYPSTTLAFFNPQPLPPTEIADNELPTNPEKKTIL